MAVCRDTSPESVHTRRGAKAKDSKEIDAIVEKQAALHVSALRAKEEASPKELRVGARKT